MEHRRLEIVREARGQVIGRRQLVVDGAGHAVDQRNLPGRLDADVRIDRRTRHERRREQGVRRGEAPGAGRVGSARAGRLQVVLGHRVKGQLARMDQMHERIRQGRVQFVPGDEHAEHDAVSRGHGHDERIGLGDGGVVDHVRGDRGRRFRVAHGNGQGAFDGLGGVGRAAGFFKGYMLLDAPPPGLADGLAGVVPRAAYGRAIEQRKQVLVQAAAEILPVVAAPRDQGAHGEREDESGLGKLAGLAAVVVAARLRVGVAADPVAVVAAQRVQVVVPVRPEPQRVADQRAHERAARAVADVLARHGGRLLSSFGLCPNPPTQTPPWKARPGETSRGRGGLCLRQGAPAPSCPAARKAARRARRPACWHTRA